jgi:dihydrofolate reductase
VAAGIDGYHCSRLNFSRNSRETFEGFAAAWPSMEEAEGEFAVRMNTLPKYVASRTLKEPLPWNGTLLEGDVAEAVTKLKEQPGDDIPIYGDDILIYGSARLLNTLLAHDLIDRCQLVIFPVAVGAGKRLFTGDAGLKAFRLAQAATTSTGVAILTCESARA